MRNSRSFTVLATTLVSGCSMLTPPLEHPVIEEKLNPRFLTSATVGTLSLTPERRIVLVNFSNNRYCAEPPTETGMDLSRVLQAAAQVTKSGQSAGIEGTLATTVQNAVLNKRSQGLQYFLASSFYLCQMYMNGAISPEDLIRLQIQMINAAGPLIEKEIQFIHASPITPNGFKPLDPNEAIKDLAKPKTAPVPAAPAKAASSP